ncbi:GNAT family N-acetyltransferase [Nocardia jejuensis]|uniref:GNAT family N-acetyltransferase n=1 Tax=Nocardia jejuensis TaxID=328049 RepID=UPI00082A53EF|nr:GNAT family N-acetyltransferase [Nocardia jejuensis]
MSDYVVREALPHDLAGARSVMLDTFYTDLGYGYLPEHHDDVIDPGRAYLCHPRQRLWVARHDDQVVATTAIRARGPRIPPHPAWLADRYPDHSTAQLFRVYVRAEHRRRGLATELVRRAIDFARGTTVFERLYLHTDASVPGALDFWKSLGVIVHDDRAPERRFQTVHLEIPLR